MTRNTGICLEKTGDVSSPFLKAGRAGIPETMTDAQRKPFIPSDDRTYRNAKERSESERSCRNRIDYCKDMLVVDL